ncbi:Extracellular matrix-binding ebh, putative [Babesia ovata]|uniref:Extracellular matrix-binding ebh, putative n=1 Tax=Babesia ovata TaxID=189622 RepID=A0A2H6KIL8_9APIC|nr:Extracellular matrix-binding ebh, putative [Babesia ovata]GBE62835.1 Extracellular matrix-binding ebh, putative [Babesia ovata]
MAHLAHDQMAHLAPNQTAYLAHNQTSNQAPNLTAYLTCNLPPNLLDPLISPLLAALAAVICDHIVAINTANDTLLHHVTSLNSWITDAEKIRAAAEKKAKEAYDKLKVNETLDLNVKKIVDANKAIKEVNKSLENHLSSLGAWKQQAGTVLGGAIQKAKEVHDHLVDSDIKKPLGEKIKNIEDNNSLIIQANTQLGTEVTALGKWRAAAKDVITKAEGKCDEIMQRVHKDNPQKTEIHQNANKLKEKAESLLNAYKETFTKVSALDGQVRGAVEDLEKGMKDDLVRLQREIVKNMKEHVGGMLGEIKTQVGEIKGEKGTKGKDDKWTNGSGIEAVANALISSYANAFSEAWSFKRIVGGWAEGILGNNKPHDKKEIKPWLGQYVNERGGNGDQAVRLLDGSVMQFVWSNKIIDQIKTKLHSEIEAGRTQVQQTDGQITQTITSVKNACEEFVKGLDNKLASDGIQKLAQEIYDKIASEGGPRSYGGTNYKAAIHPAIQAALICLSATASQVGEELKSVFLENRVGDKCIAQELDKVVEETRELDKNLGEAEKVAKNDPSSASLSQGQNKILESVQGIEGEVNKGMKDDDGSGVTVEKAMTTYIARKDTAAAGGNSLYKKLINEDIKNSLSDFTKMQGFKEQLKDENVDPQKREVGTHVSTIEKELQEIAERVDSSKRKTLPSKPDEYGVKQRLEDLGDMLKETESVSLKGKADGIPKDTVKGLAKIHEEIKSLHEKTYVPQANEIGQAVTQIKVELQDLRGKLKKENGGELGVIDKLQNFRNYGLEDGNSAWTSEDKKAMGLKKIQMRLKEQNAILPGQTKIIENALDIVVKEINWQLRLIGFRLNDDRVNDDVLDNLRRLDRKLGKNKYKDGDNLNDIYYTLYWLQDWPFKQYPNTINQAKQEIVKELNTLRGVLQGSTPGEDVITTLNDLQTSGLNGQKWDKNAAGKNKSLSNIENDLSTQQNTLGQQPEQIGGGVQSITTELDKLRDTLNIEVTEKLDDLKNHGLGNGQTWTIDNNSAKGLAKITADIIAIKDKDVEDVKDKLKMLLSDIKHEARSLAFVLKEVKEIMLDEEMKKIYSDLYDLYFGPLDNVIQLLKKFDKYADEAAKRIIADLHAFVDKEIKEAEEILIKEVRRQCVSNIKEALEAFARKVEEELTPLPPLINEDLQIGYKGFMYDFQQRFESHISPLKGTLQLEALSTGFKRFHLALSGYISTEIRRVHSEESKKKNPSLPQSEDHYAERLYGVTHALEELLEHIGRGKRFDRRLPEMLDKLAEAVGALRPEKFAKVTTPILDGVAEAADKFEKELRTVYISTYDGAFEGRVLVDARNSRVTTDGEKCAFVLLTITDTLFRDLNELRMHCADEWSDKLINPFTPLGAFLQQRGYRVTSAGVPDGELRNDSDCSGQKIRELTDNIMEPLDELHEYLKCYLRACHLHIPPSPKYPGTVRDILAWFAGLPYSVLYERVQAHCNVLFRGEGDAVVKHCLGSIPGALSLVTHRCSALLTTICGNGRGFDHADYPYACNFWDNSRGLHYPSDLADLLHMLTHLCKCLLLALNFLRARCKYDAATGHGWRDCQYGRSVPAASWQCNKHLMCEPNGRPTCRPNGQPMCQSTCQPKSPLQAHLMDHLAGFLPHKLASVGCDSQCDTCSIASPGMPCVTPMGFWDLTEAASIVGSGEQICAVLTALCSGAESPLPTLLRCLSSIDPSPPQSLGDMFAFYCNVFRCRQSAEYVDNVHFTGHLSTAAIPSVSLYLCPTTEAAQLTDALTRLYYSADDHSGASPTDAVTNTLQATHSDLSSLTVRSRCADSLTCAPYLQPLSFHAYHTFPEKHAEVYVSWVIYTAWRFWELLQQFLNAFQDIDCASSGCSTCPCNPGQHGVDLNCKCKALVSCHGVLPTFHAYGFTFGNTRALHGNNRKYCRNFAKQLSQVLHSDHFTHLFDQCDQYLYRIRAPFLFTLFTLWLTATFYIAHSLLYRIDVLHIRSHLLTTRASHLIDVKALLAGSRRMLSLYKDIDYFDDDFHSGKLKKDGDSDKTAVVNALQDLKEKGLGGHWTIDNGDWKTTKGLAIIQERLKTQNAILPVQTKSIDTAIKEIKGELARIGIKLNNVHTDHDIMDHLKQLANYIGKGKSANGYSLNVQKIHDVISALQSGVFTQKPTDIENANSAIKDELTTLQGLLQGSQPGDDVIGTLKDLRDTGLSDKQWKNKNGIKNIENDLKGQQTTLSSQPEKIGGGVQEITTELTKLQKDLQNNVTDKLKKLKDHGLTDGSTPWTMNNQSLTGLTKITADIVAIKDKDVDNVKYHLVALCSAIRHNARDLRDILKEVKENLVGELTKIKHSIRQLHKSLVDGPIKDLRSLLSFIVNGKAQLIKYLTQFVNQEIKEAEETLIREARRQYLSNIKELLKLFAQKVEEELSPLPPLINGDLHIGYKGFMKQVEGKPETQVAGAQGEFEKFEEFVRTLPTEPKERVFKKLAAVFMHFYGELKAYIHKEIRRVHSEESKKKNPVPQEPETLYTDKLVRVTLSLNALLEYIRTEDTFDHRLQALLRSLTDALSHLKPESFARPSTPLLDGLVEGLTKFAAEFTCAYVSAYAGAQFTDEEGEKCAKVFLTMLPTLCDAFTRLAEQCGKGGKWRDLKINSSSQLGKFLHRCGYKVSTSPTLQDGELRDECNGRDVYVLVSQKIEETENNEHLKKCLSLQHACNLLQLLKCLCTHLTEYYRTCHLKLHPSPRPPCSIYEMLTWCCGLTHNPVHLTVTHDAMPSLFGADEQGSSDSDVPLMNLSSLALKAHPRNITPASLTDALTEVCHQSHSVLTTLLGFGHAGGIYACDFNTNPQGLLYPGDADALLCLLFDVLRRLHHQLFFLYRRCLYNARHGGWLDCWYGRGVGGSSWKCNIMQCANQICDQQCNQTHNQICNLSCEQHPKCGVKSPLQSFLEDGLVGFLPHQLSPKDTCVSCSGCDTESPGLPCKTPMGLSNITRLASRASTGRRIMDVLGAFCGGASSPLTRLCGFLTCLLTRPPRTPDELFAFYFNFISEWRSSGEHRKAAFEDAVGDACFWQRGVTLDVSTVFGTSSHGPETEMPHLTGDLFSLVECNGSPRSAPPHPCGPYLKPLGHDVRATFAKAHAHLYLSWVVYLTETFYDLLCSLLQDCERNCADATSTCHANSCDNQCPAKRLPMAPDSEHLESCLSIADCDSITPTLFRYGFALRDVHSLAGSTSGYRTKRTCEDFCTALQIVLKQMNPLHRLAHDTIPEYLYRIRAPFLFTLFTLWLTATLYILHSLLYRMDVMHIRSHLLTTRASHLIDVKALLAGSRRMLSLYKDVDYFDDDFHS